MPDLAIIVPTRGRPENIRKVISAWDFTNAWDHADLILVADADDPEIQGYRDLAGVEGLLSNVTLIVVPKWLPMVRKLNAAAVNLAEGRRYFALGFAGDDHLPQTIGWAERYLATLRELGTGMVYGDDGYQGRKLSTEWAITSDVVRALGRMVPADVEHMYCDNSMMDLFQGAGALRHLPGIRIEHMHPVTGKAPTDEQYQRVNHRDQFSKDRRAYEAWRDKWKISHVALIRELRKGRPDVINEPTPARPRVAGSGPRKVVQRSGPSVRRDTQPSRLPRHFRNVRAATPEDIMITLADFATQVPADQEIVELGVFQGRTALQLAWGAAQGHGAHVTAIDAWDLPGNTYAPPFTDPESKRWAKHWVESLGYTDKISLIQNFAARAAEIWDVSKGDQPVGLLFVDDDHSREGVRAAITGWAPHLAEGAIIAIDDHGHPDWPGVAEGVAELVAEGVLEPVEIFHDRLAVTRLAVKDDSPVAVLPGVRDEVNGTWIPPIIGTEKELGVTAITSEGVSPSPYPAVGDQVAVTVDLGSAPTVHRDEVDDLFDGPDSAPSTPHPSIERDREHVHAGELEAVTNGTPIGELNLVNLKALAKARGIVLGARKDKRDLILAALRSGK